MLEKLACMPEVGDIRRPSACEVPGGRSFMRQFVVTPFIPQDFTQGDQTLIDRVSPSVRLWFAFGSPLVRI